MDGWIRYSCVEALGDGIGEIDILIEDAFIDVGGEGGHELELLEIPS